MRLEISRRGVQFLAPESLCSPSYEGLKVRVSQNTMCKKNNGLWRWNLSKKIGLEISRRGVQFLAPESLCSPSYEGLKVHVSQNTILEKWKYGIWHWNLSKKIGLEMSRRGVQFLAPESLCSPSYEGLKVHVSQNTILTLKPI